MSFEMLGKRFLNRLSAANPRRIIGNQLGPSGQVSGGLFGVALLKGRDETLRRFANRGSIGFAIGLLFGCGGHHRATNHNNAG